MNISVLRLLAVSVLLLSSQCSHLDRRTEVEVEVGPAPPFQVIEENTQSNRLDVWHPLRPNNKVRQRYLLVKRKKAAAQRRFGSGGFHYPAPAPAEKLSFHPGKLDERDELKVSENSDGWLSFLVDPLLSLVRSFSLLPGLVSQGAEDRQSLAGVEHISTRNQE